MSCHVCPKSKPIQRCSLPEYVTPTPENPIRLPLAFHIPKRFYQTSKDGMTMNMWLTPYHIATIYYEVNRIWAPTGIRFTFAGCCCNYDEPNLESIQALITLQHAHRDLTEEEDKIRQKAILSLSKGLGRNRAGCLNVHFVPYMGVTRQGNAVGRDTTVLCGVWTDKPSLGQHPPEKTPIKEEGKFKHGSLSRTVAHELGHIMGLNHNPDGQPAPSPNIMGNPDGYGFTESQIKTAVIEARRHCREFEYGIK